MIKSSAATDTENRSGASPLVNSPPGEEPPEPEEDEPADRLPGLPVPRGLSDDHLPTFDPHREQPEVPGRRAGDDPTVSVEHPIVAGAPVAIVLRLPLDGAPGVGTDEGPGLDPFPGADELDPLAEVLDLEPTAIREPVEGNPGDGRFRRLRRTAADHARPGETEGNASRETEDRPSRHASRTTLVPEVGIAG